MASTKVWDAFLLHGSVSTDSRKIKEGDLFFALSGEHFDGNQFAAKALSDGASLVVVDNPAYMVEGDSRYVLVGNALKELQDLALQYRRTFKIPIIGITGTNGKTTSKELINAVLATTYRVHATVGNLNNHIGVPLTLLAMPTDTDVAIVEMGANKHGDIKELVEIAEPTICVVTNIGRAHLERFGDIEGVEQTKGEMFDFAASNGRMAVVNMKDLRVERRARQVPERITYGLPGCDYWISNLNTAPDHLDLEVTFGKSGQSYRFISNLIGAHNAENVLLATALGDILGVSVNSIREGLKGYFPKLNRTELIRTSGFNLLLDAYNANPSSMEATLRGMHAQGLSPVTLILGDMFELGPDSHRFHVDLVTLVRELFPDGKLLGVGKEMVAAVLECGFGVAYATLDEASEVAASMLEGSKWVLVKGSRGMALERILPALGVERSGVSGH
jgi:UDP-N-acetylmuramoyl-tripeptide--D-alanyl-D-alanine ligase